MKRSILYILVTIFMLPGAFAQKESKDVRAGNRFYKDQKYADAEISYRKGLDKNKKSFEANFNLGDALYKQGKYPEAMQQFAKAAPLDKDKGRVAAAFHNIGNSFFKTKEYGKSIDAYKASLKLSPNDKQTRYNLALAQAMLKNQQNNNKNNKNNKNKGNKKQQNKQQNKQDKNQGDKNQQKQPQPQPDNKMSKENANQILDAFLQDEKDVQNRVKENQKKNAQKRKVDKDW